MAPVARGCIFGVLLAGSCWSTRIRDNPERVVFGEAGETVYFTAPDLPSGSRRCTWPETMKFRDKVDLTGDVTARTGLALKNLRREDKESLFTVTVRNDPPIRYRAAVAGKIEVDVGATLYLTLDGKWESSSSITWKYTSTSETKSTDFDSVLEHGKFKGRVRVDDATGKLSISDWRSRDDGFFTAEINGEEFAENFNVVSIVRVKPGGDLHLAPDFAGHISQFSWYRNKTLLVEYNAAGGGVVFRFSHCVTVSGNCIFDVATGKLTIKSWRHAFDGEFTMMINGESCKSRIKVVGDVIFAPFNEIVQLDPPPFTGNLDSIVWQHDGDLAAEFYGDDTVEYFQICAEGNCILNTTNGTLTLSSSSWDPFDRRRFTVTVNNHKQPNEYLVAGIGKLNRIDDVSVKLQAVSDTKTMMICDGDFDGAEPVTYFWQLHGSSDWVQGTQFMETSHVFVRIGRFNYEYDACKVVNPVSERVIVLN